ncbi:DUF317 domain-containing protein [Streptomyces sp. NPDC058440]|uniref:DUF317 domain-containing protein n=1 Tax=Streptomyces sp. NPDC058440 TaxID=3346501 RepID=UPI00365F19FB
MAHERNDAGVQFDAFAAWTLWAGPSVNHPAWSIRASAYTPAALLAPAAPPPVGRRPPSSTPPPSRRNRPSLIRQHPGADQSTRTCPRPGALNAA